METLAKGLAVLAAFGPERATMTLTEAAAAAGLSRATARRVLRTLTALGYVEQGGRDFSLAPRILELGFAYLATHSWIERAAPLMRELSNSARDSCSVAILQESRSCSLRGSATAHRLMSTAIDVGTRLPAFHSALGRAQLGFLDDAELWRRLRSIRLEPFTASTITDPRALIERIREDHAQGFSIVDEELEKGLRAIAVPIVSRRPVAVAAINLSAHASRTTRNEMREQFLPRLREAAARISAFLG